jgi:hypothetical protein
MTSRREFGLTIARAAASLKGGSQLERSDSTSPEGPSNSAIVEGNTEVEARYANALRIYGARLSESQRQHLRRILEQNERMLANVRKFPVQNADTPATTLRLESRRWPGA